MAKKIKSYKDLPIRWRAKRNCFQLSLRAIGGGQRNFKSKPKHYTQGKVECIEAIDSMLEDSSQVDFYRSQIVKYIWRLRDKGDPLKDAKKAEFYLCRLIEKLGQ